MKHVRNWIMIIALTASVGGASFSLAIPQTVMAADRCTDSFIGLPAWYRGLTKPYPDCDIKSPGTSSGGLSNFIWHIVLNILEGVFVITGYLTGFYLLYGGFLFISSQGNPEKAVKARLTMSYALIGLVVAMTAIAVVNFVVNGVLS